MQQFEAEQKFFNLPELVETLFLWLDPLSFLSLVQSRVINKEILQKSLTSKVWVKIIGSGEVLLQKEEVKELVKILKLAELKEPRAIFSRLCVWADGSYNPALPKPMFGWVSAWLRLQEMGQKMRGESSSTMRGKSDREAAWKRRREMRKKVNVKSSSTSEEMRENMEEGE